MFEAIIPLVDSTDVLTVFGARDQHVRRLRDALGVEISHRDGKIRVRGDETSVTTATETIEQLREIVERRGVIAPDDVTLLLSQANSNGEVTDQKPVEVMQAGRQVRARTPGQADYLAAIRENELIFSIGPAGTGKTYLAVAAAVESLKREDVRKIVLVRPAVEAGESLGFLPGDLQAKINPYLRPLLDALREMMDYEQIERFRERDVIELIPLAYMRGRTLNEAFIILDEAQNTTVSQMKMFLTRMGAGSKIVVSGDITQTDLPSNTRSGLTDAITRLKGIKGFQLVKLTNADIVRHRLVQEIVRAYEEGPKKRKR
jgi:phosphate starvation-inducible PhoH-like protein